MLKLSLNPYEHWKFSTFFTVENLFKICLNTVDKIFAC